MEWARHKGEPGATGAMAVSASMPSIEAAWLDGARPGRLLDLVDAVEVNAIIARDLTAAFHTIRHAVPGMRKRKWGRIIGTASAKASRAWVGEDGGGDGGHVSTSLAGR